MITPLAELDARPHDEILDGPGHQDFPLYRERAQAGCNMHRQTPEITLSDFALPGVKPHV